MFAKCSTYDYPFQSAPDGLKRMVWEKGFAIPGFNRDHWRRDICGKVMRYADHGNTMSVFGWEIDHVFPRALGGRTLMTNLQPLQWENNRLKGDQFPWWCRKQVRR